MPTSISNASAYCSGSDFVNYYDVRQCGDLLQDANSRMTSAQVAASTVLSEFLKAASGEVESACFVAKKYSAADLAALDGNAAALLRKIVADLAFWEMAKRRHPTRQDVTEAYRSSKEFLDRLRLGERIFGLEDQADAGNPESQFKTQNDINTLNLSTTISRRFWGVRSKERRPY